MAIETWQIVVMAVSATLTCAFLALIRYRMKRLQKMVNEHRFKYQVQTIRASSAHRDSKNISVIEFSGEDLDAEPEPAKVDSKLSVVTSDNGVYDTIGVYRILNDGLAVTKSHDGASEIVDKVNKNDGLIYVVEQSKDRIRIVHPKQGWTSLKNKSGEANVQKVGESTLLDATYVACLKDMFKRNADDKKLNKDEFLKATHDSGNFKDSWPEYSLDGQMYWCQFFRFAQDLHRAEIILGVQDPSSQESEFDEHPHILLRPNSVHSDV